jgi:hypothetical protein
MATICTFTKRGKREEEKRENFLLFDDESMGTRDSFIQFWDIKNLANFSKKGKLEEFTLEKHRISQKFGGKTTKYFRKKKSVSGTSRIGLCFFGCTF